MRLQRPGLAALAALLLAVACAPPGAPQARTPATPKPGSIDAAITTAEHFVEQHRGLRFKSKVKVTYLDDAVFQSRVKADNESDPDQTARDSKELRAVRLIPPGTDLQKVEDELLSVGVLGFYDPKKKELVVRGRSVAPETQHVLVHELTHALQDQWFGIEELNGTDPTREDDAYRSLVEGDARRIETQFLQSLTPDQRRQAQGGGAALPPDVPQVLAEIISFPYVIGPPFTQALLSDGGQPRLDAAFTSAKPRYTAEVIHPDRYLAGFNAAPVDRPPVAGAQFDAGIFGEEDLVYILERGAARPSSATIRDIAGAWRGDAYVAYDRPDGGPCVRVAMRMDSPAHAQQLAALLRPTGGFAVDAVTGTGLTWTACA